MPNACAAPARQEAGMGYLVNWHVPIDDTSHWKYMFLFNWNEPLDQKTVLRDRFTFETTADYKSKLNKSNRYHQNRASVKTQSYSGTGNNFQLQDLLITECAGTVQDRTREHLVASDAPLVISRKVMLKAIHDVQQGLEPPRMTAKPPGGRGRNTVVALRHNSQFHRLERVLPEKGITANRRLNCAGKKFLNRLPP